jgi:arylsulfatase A-like enzyme
MLRTDRHKLVAVHSLDTGELYDLDEDPNETRNLWDDPAHQAIKGRLLGQLADRMAWTVDPLGERVAPY